MEWDWLEKQEGYDILRQKGLSRVEFLDQCQARVGHIDEPVSIHRDAHRHLQKP